MSVDAARPSKPHAFATLESHMVRAWPGHTSRRTPAPAPHHTSWRVAHSPARSQFFSHGDSEPKSKKAKFAADAQFPAGYDIVQKDGDNRFFSYSKGFNRRLTRSPPPPSPRRLPPPARRRPPLHRRHRTTATLPAPSAAPARRRLATAFPTRRQVGGHQSRDRVHHLHARGRACRLRGGHGEVRHRHRARPVWHALLRGTFLAITPVLSPLPLTDASRHAELRLRREHQGGPADEPAPRLRHRPR